MRRPSIRYRVQTVDGGPPPGAIIMGVGPRVRRAHLVLSAERARSGQPALGITTWRLFTEPMSAQRGLEMIEAGSPHWPIYWDSRKRKAS